jgi:hypothetical protein
LQDERRQRQPQIIQFFNPGVVPVLHGECSLWFEARCRWPRRVDIPSAGTAAVHATFNGRRPASPR